MMKNLNPVFKKLLTTLSIDQEPAKLYIQNHAFFLKYFASIGFLIIFSKFYFYGFPEIDQIAIFLFALLPISALFAYEQIKLYKKLDKMSYKAFLQNRTKSFFLITLNKIGYTVPWLVFLFWPLHATFFYYHILGYAFIFCIIAIYPSISSPVWPLFIVDITLQLIFLLFITTLNNTVQETPIAGLFILTFSFYAVVSAYKMNQTYKELFTKNQDIQSALKQTKHAHEAKAEFLAIMSHEIRTPMNGIMGMIDFLEETKLDEDQSQCIKTIHECSDSLINTLNDVLDYSKIEAGKFSIRKINFNLHELTQHIFNMFRLKMAEKQITFHLDMYDNVPEYIYSDPNRIQQIIVNLLNNAHKFTNNGIVQFTISYQDSKIVFKIEDSGIGISEENKEKLFKRYSQIKDDKLEDPGGTGLGLVIVKQLTVLLGGNISFESNKDIGTTFSVELPYMPPIHIDEVSPASHKGHEENTKLRILLVDDNKLNQQIVERYLKNKGHKVFIATSGRQALDFLEQGHDLHIILMDLHMPDIDGMEATKQIRKTLPKYDNVPVIALTANLTEDTLRKWYEVGIAAHIPKPIQKEEFFNTIVHHAIHAHFLSPNQNSDCISENNNHKLVALSEEFGPDYAVYVIEKNLKEVERLTKKIQCSWKNNNLETVKSCIHDLITTSGNIGMEKTSELSKNIENLFNQGFYKKGIEETEKLFSFAEKEIKYARNFVRHLSNVTIEDPVEDQ